MFRDDLVFLVFMYQRWIYRVDKTRVNEFGWSEEMVAKVCLGEEVCLWLRLWIFYAGIPLLSWQFIGPAVGANLKVNMQCIKDRLNPWGEHHSSPFTDGESKQTMQGVSFPPSSCSLSCRHACKCTAWQRRCTCNHPSATLPTAPQAALAAAGGDTTQAAGETLALPAGEAKAEGQATDETEEKASTDADAPAEGIVVQRKGKKGKKDAAAKEMAVESEAGTSGGKKKDK